MLRIDADAFDLSDDTFTRIPRAYDWRNYIRRELRDHWHTLTPRERLLLAFNAQDAADEDVWTLDME